MIRIKVNINLTDVVNKEIAAIKAKKIAEMVAGLKEATPIDTGEARDGWRAEKNAIVNDVDHIDDLNRGTSKQAPALFIEQSLLTHTGVRPSGTIVKAS
jgi:hypothetical protein